MKTIILTGAAGFIGFHLTKKLLSENFNVIGIDNINDYYDPKLKLARLKELGINKINEAGTVNNNFTFYKFDIEDKEKIEKVFKKYKPDYVINLAAQAGVRYSIVNPDSYISRNIIGFYNILELSRKFNIKHLVFASSSSVYGLNEKYPFNEDDSTDHPASLYAATKKSNEMFAHTYSNIFNLPTTGLRFFTVYGPWGRPDMMFFKIAESLTKNTEIEVYNNGKLWRDYTYVDDIVEGIYKTLKIIPKKNLKWNAKNPISSKSSAPYRILNIGKGKPVMNIDFIKEMEKAFNKKLNYKNVKAPDTEVFKTFADTTKLEELTNYKPKVDFKEGVRHFAEWYKSYYKIK